MQRYETHALESDVELQPLTQDRGDFDKKDQDHGEEICIVIRDEDPQEPSTEMKFTHDLKFNKAPDWKDNYVDYWHLKKLIYKNEKTAILQKTATADAERLSSPFPRRSSDQESLLPQLSRGQSERRQDSEGLTTPFNAASRREPTSPLLRRTNSGGSDEFDEDEGGLPAEDDNQFMQLLQSELDKVLKFYSAKENELIERSRQLAQEKTDAETTFRAPSGRPQSHDTRSHRALEINSEFWSSNNVEIRIKRETLREELRDLYVKLHDLIAYNELNREGFRKALKKHDKVLARVAPKRLPEQRPKWEAVLSVTSKQKLEGTMEHVLSNYAQICCDGNEQLASLELKRQLRDRLVYERQTVWKEMVERERRKGNVTVESGKAERQTWWTWLREPLALLLSIAVFTALLVSPTFEEVEKRNCLAMLVFVSLLWCTEALPLFVTSMLVPFLTVVLGVMVDTTTDPPHRLTPKESAPKIFHTMFSQVIMLLLGGFAIASALSKHYIAKAMATWVLLKVGQKPSHVLLASMFVAMFASMWISNVAAPALCFSLLQPILRTLHTGDNTSKSLVMGIALASNLGGMTSPISSPQNIFAIERMSMVGGSPSWLSWFAIALPVSIISAFIIWFILICVYPANVKAVHQLPELKDKLNLKQAYVIGMSILTVALWCANSWLQRWTGEMGIIAILPLVAFFGFGILGKDDFNGFLWNVVMLAMGGLALGEAVTSSGLLKTIAHEVSQAVDGYNVWVILLIFCALVLVATTFISHTVGAMVILPIVQTVGSDLPDPHPKLLVMAAALMCSGAMGLPVSGFPNMTAISLEDATGRTYIKTIDFLKTGLLSSFVTYIVVVTVGYLLMVFVTGW